MILNKDHCLTSGMPWCTSKHLSCCCEAKFCRIEFLPEVFPLQHLMCCRLQNLAWKQVVLSLIITNTKIAVELSKGTVVFCRPSTSAFSCLKVKTFYLQCCMVNQHDLQHVARRRERFCVTERARAVRCLHSSAFQLLSDVVADDAWRLRQRWAER